MELLFAWHCSEILYAVEPNFIILLTSDHQNSRISCCIEYNLIHLAMTSVEALPIGKGVSRTM